MREVGRQAGSQGGREREREGEVKSRRGNYLYLVGATIGRHQRSSDGVKPLAKCCNRARKGGGVFLRSGPSVPGRLAPRPPVYLPVRHRTMPAYLPMTSRNQIKKFHTFG